MKTCPRCEREQSDSEFGQSTSCRSCRGRVCPDCAGKKSPDRQRCHACWITDLDRQPHGTSSGSAHRRARRICPPGPCVFCGSPDAKDVDHIDGDFTNNDPANLRRFCRSCHMSRHRPKARCTICGQPQEARGLCALHYTRLRRYGDPHRSVRARGHYRKTQRRTTRLSAFVYRRVATTTYEIVEPNGRVVLGVVWRTGPESWASRATGSTITHQSRTREHAASLAVESIEEAS